MMRATGLRLSAPLRRGAARTSHAKRPLSAPFPFRWICMWHYNYSLAAENLSIELGR